MKKSNNRNISFLRAVFSGFLAFVLFFVLLSLSPAELNIELSNDNGIEGEIYINTGNGYSAEEHKVFELLPDGKIHQYTLNVKTSFPHSIRIDPGEQAGKIYFKNINFKTKLFTKTISCSELRLLHGLQPIEDSECLLQATDADPYLDFTLITNFDPNTIEIKWLVVLEGIIYSILVFILAYTIIKPYENLHFRNTWFFNRHTKRLYAILFLGFSSFVFLNLSVSSIGMWKEHVPSDIRSGVLLGHAQGIRSDEWLVQTPFYASQVANGFSVSNPSLGADGVAYTATVPVQGLYGYSQPRFWGFYWFGFEKGLSWLYAWRVFGLILSNFVLLAIVTKGNFWLSIGGSIWIAFSPFVQWWFTTNLPDMLIGFSAGIAALYLLLFSRTILSGIISSIVLFFAGITFFTALYPAFQIPLFYLALFIIIGLVARDSSKENLKHLWKYKAILLSLVISILAFIILLWLNQASTIIEIIQNSVYPGKRVSLGGDASLAEVFSGYYGSFLSSNNFPQALGNVCGAGNFLMMFPLSLLIFISHVYQKRKMEPLALSLSLYIMAVLVWMLFGFPEWLATTTKMSMSPSLRTLLGLGIANILLVVYVFTILNQQKSAKDLITEFNRKDAFMVVILLTVFSGTAFYLSQAFPDFITWRRTLIIVPILVIWGFAYIKGAQNLLLLLTTILVVTSLKVNPLTLGVSSLQNRELTNIVTEKNTKWFVADNLVHPQYLKANGATVWNGTRFMSDSKEMKILDPNETYRNIWYRYAHFVIEPLKTGEAIVFELKQTDLIVMKVDICSDAVHKLGINRVAFLTEQTEERIPCLIPLRNKPVAGLWLYKRIE